MITNLRMDIFEALMARVCVAGAVRAGIEIPRDDCEWRAGDEGNMANRCDGDQIAVGACGGGFNNDCPGSSDTVLSL